MNKKFILPIALALMLTACPKVPDPVPEPEKYTVNFVNYDSTVLQSKEYEKGEMPVYYGETPTKPEDDDYTYDFSGWDKEIVTVTEDTTYTATYTSTEKSKVIDLGVKTIAEVRTLCEELTNLNESGIAVDMTRKVTIKGLAVSKTFLTKTTKKFGLDVSSAYKILFGDASGYIGVASAYSKDGNTLWGKCQEHVGKSTSSYEVTGYLSMYLGRPELYVPGKTFTWNQDLNIKFDDVKNALDDISLDEFYTIATETRYNCGGYAYGDIYTVSGLKCFDHRDEVYFCTDGNSVLKVYEGNATLSVGATYDVTGYVSLNKWVPTLSALSAKISTKTVDMLEKTDATETTIANFKKNKASKDDTNTKQTNYILSYKTLYKASVYASCYTENGKFYVTIGDNFDSSKEYCNSHLKAHISLGQIAISNENNDDQYWNLEEEEMYTYCPLSYWLFENEKVDVYFYQYIQEWGSYGGKNDQPIWKVMVIKDMLPEIPEVQE